MHQLTPIMEMFWWRTGSTISNISKSVAELNQWANTSNSSEPIK